MSGAPHPRQTPLGAGHDCPVASHLALPTQHRLSTGLGASRLVGSGGDTLASGDILFAVPKVEKLRCLKCGGELEYIGEYPYNIGGVVLKCKRCGCWRIGFPA